ncbi:MAG: DNA polymerase III subunit gamma/tau [Parvibaculaceae bacterium]
MALTEHESAGPSQSPGEYRVLARKYRPRRFEDLIGQDAVVRTLTNAFATGRIAHAYMLTGVRGVGKTTTARLIARALNYTGPGSEGGPTTSMPEMGEHCEAILESRHPDVIEMDAASRTGVDDVREIIEQVRYRPIAARTKVYIIDEVHMLSKNAFNALLKTLEEPPEHVKFIFATTETRKVPVTVLSRCQRFDLRRVDGALLMRHLAEVSAAEGVEPEEEALRMIARAAEGSVRDSLSLLDQAIAYGGKMVKAADVQSMLGLADRARVVDLFEAVMRGDMPKAIAEIEAQYALGSDPLAILTDLADFVHWVTRLKVAPETEADAARSEVEIRRGREFAATLAMPHLARAWQMLLKGLEEAGQAANPLAAAEMVLIRLAYSADLPDPASLVRDAQGNGVSARPSPECAPSRDGGGARALRAVAPEPASRPAPRLPEPSEAPRASALPMPTDFPAIVALAGAMRDLKLKLDLERFVRPVRVSLGKLEIALEPGASPSFPGEISRKLEAWTGGRWMVLLHNEGGERPIAEQKKALKDDALRSAREHPSVRAVLDKFPGAEILEVRDRGAYAAEAGPPPDEQPE